MKNAQKEKRYKEDLAILREKFLGNICRRLSISSNDSTCSTPRNKLNALYKSGKEFAALYRLTYLDFTSLDLDETFEKKKIRIDNFGQEIKKGGKHKIVFADELQKVKTLESIKYQNKKENIDNNKRSNSFPKCKGEIKAKNEKEKNIKRNNSFDISKRYLVNHLNNIDLISNKKPNKFNNVDIIDFESTKKENKLNTYFFKKKIVVPDDDKACCSCYCSIF